jgi:hypothetical protein
LSDPADVTYIAIHASSAAALFFRAESMNDNPFRDLPEQNPYASPPLVDRGRYGNPLIGPAIALLVLSACWTLLQLLALPGQFISMTEIDTSEPEGISRLVGQIIGIVAMFITSLIIIVGSIGMLRLRGYGGALTAAIVAAIPICSPCFILGIPFGVWAIVLLRKPEIKSRFS